MLRIDWQVIHGWADCRITDQDAEVTFEGSYIAETPTELLIATARVFTSESEARVEFEAEPTAYRWILRRDGADVRMRVLHLPTSSSSDQAGREIWTSVQPVGVLVRAVIRCFDTVATTYGEDEYRVRWGRPFPRFELEALRTLWRAKPSAPTASSL